jgi:hypothetical protein
MTQAFSGEQTMAFRLGLVPPVHLVLTGLAAVMSDSLLLPLTFSF